MMRSDGALTLAIVIALSALCALAGAQEELPPLLTLEEALRLAVERNPQIAIAEADLRGREAALDSQRGRWLPQLVAGWSWRWQQSLPRTINVGGGTIETQRQRTTTRDASLTLNQTFYQSGLPEAIDAARQQVRASEASLENTRRTLLAQVAGTFYAILANQELAAVAEKAVEVSQRHLELVDARIEAGTAAPADRLQIEAELADAELEAVSTVNATWQSIAQLRELLALPQDTLPLLSGSLDGPRTSGDLDAWLTEAETERPDLIAQEHRVRAAELSLRQAEIDSGLSYSFQGSADWGRFTGNTGESWFLGASASFPLYSKQARASVDQAQASLESARQRLEQTKLSVAREVSQAYYALRDANQRVAAAEASLAAAQTNLDAAQARYAEGVVDVITVTDAELTWRRTAARLVQARFDRNVAYYQLLAAAGRQLTEPGPPEPTADTEAADDETVIGQ